MPFTTSLCVFLFPSNFATFSSKILPSFFSEMQTNESSNARSVPVSAGHEPTGQSVPVVRDGARTRHVADHKLNNHLVLLILDFHVQQ